ncbi:MAG: PH domain-containing protein [Gemmatimonadota bacterium]
MTATEPALRSLDPRAVTLWRLSLGIRGVVLTVGALLTELLVVQLPVPAGTVAAAVAVAFGVATAVIPSLRYRSWGFALGDEHVYLRHGILFRTTSIVPYARIQHVDTRHGPIDRWLGLASLVVFTAGTRGAMLTIPALAGEEAEEMRDRLAALSGAGDAV